MSAFLLPLPPLPKIALSNCGAISRPIYLKLCKKPVGKPGMQRIAAIA